jgi:AraC-like DNA-binding protein
MRVVVALFWGVFLFFYRKGSKQNLPLSAIFTVMGLLYLVNCFARLPHLATCDVYNVRSYVLLIFVAPFTLIYARFAVGKTIHLWKMLLHFIPFAVMLGLYMLLRACCPHIPLCYDINEALGYFSDYPLYVAYYVLLMAVFAAQVFTYFSIGLTYFLSLRRLYRLHNKPVAPVNSLVAIGFLFLCYSLFFIVYQSYNNNVALTVTHKVFDSAVITAISVLTMQLSLPLPSVFPVERSALLQLNIADNDPLNPADAKILNQLKKLFEQKHIYRQSDLRLEDVVKKCGSNRSSVSSCINRYYGCNFKQLVLRSRLLEAQELLINSDLDIMQITSDVGFNSRSAFYKAFAEHIDGNVSPVEWRQQIGLQKERLQGAFPPG